MATDEKKYKRKKKKVGSYQYGSVVFSIFLSLTVMGACGLFLLHTNQLTQVVAENFEVAIYLNKNVTKNQRTRIENELINSAYLLKKEGTTPVRFKSKEEVAEEFIRDTGEDFSEFLGDNPFHDALVINIVPEYQNTAKLDSIRDHIGEISGVFEPDYSPDVLEGIEKNKTRLTIILLGFAIVLLIVVVFLINSTIKLALFSQRFLIRSMQLVGATAGFIRKPFLSRSFMHGALGGILASAVLYGLLQFANTKVPQLQDLQQDLYIFAMFGFLVLIGGLIAFISTNWAMNKYLKMSLDELY